MRESTLLNNSNQSFDIDTWYQTQLGQTVLKLEQQQLRVLPRVMFNKNLVQLGATSQSVSGLNMPATHLFLVSTNPSKQCSTNRVQSTFEQLPFPNDSAHTVILPHVLEFQIDPKIILTEAWRILEPDGHLVILGFNPWSLWGLAKQTLNLPDHAKLHSMGKLNYWLAGLNAEIVLKRSFLFAPPFSNLKTIDTLQNSEKALTWLFPNNGGIFLLIAKKQILPLTPIRIRWNWREFLTGKPLTEPAAGNVQRG